MNKDKELAEKQAAQIIDKQYDIFELTEILERFIKEVRQSEGSLTEVQNDDLSTCVELMHKRDLMRLLGLEGGSVN